jgi:cyclophilin family peptidyl-prolyl cis-trans isomerase
MVQGGAYDVDPERRSPDEPVADESSNGLSNRRGTIAASRSEDSDSATSRFFFNLSDNTHLDATPDAAGYTVFGRVTAGLDVLDAIAALPTRHVGDLSDVPVPLVEVQSVTRLPRTASFGLGAESDPASLRVAFEAARDSGDAAETLAAVDALRRNCIALDGQQHIADAEAAIELGRVDRARYGLEQYIAQATALDPLLPRAQRLLAGLPARPVPSRIDALVADCRRPAAPTIPDGRVADLSTMQAIESEVRRHRQLGESYLSCLTSLLDSGRLNEPETIEATRRHNQMVAELTAVATRFNTAARAFKAAHAPDFGTDSASRSLP